MRKKVNRERFHSFLKAAENGHWEPAWWVGKMYLTGAGTEYDIEKAEHWYRRAAELSPHPDRDILLLSKLSRVTTPIIPVRKHDDDRRRFVNGSESDEGARIATSIAISG